MSTADRPAGEHAAGDLAAACREAGLVRLVAAADGDALAATGVLARALRATDCPFQASVVAGPADHDSTTDADATVALGHTIPTADVAVGPGPTPVSETAFRAAAALDAPADPLLAAAGASVSEHAASGFLTEAAAEAGAEARPGVAVPTTDLADGLAHSTLLHAPFSGDPDAVRRALADADLVLAAEDAADLDGEDRRRVASLVAVRTVGADGATARGAERIEHSLRPRIGGPFATIEGYGDLLDAVARVDPGAGVALALGHDARAAALDAWRTHARRTHRSIRAATTGRYEGLFVARLDADDAGVAGSGEIPVGSVARLVRDFRSPEPVALVVVDGRAAAAATDDRNLAATMADAAASVGGRASGTGQHARATFETDTAEFIMSFREAL